MGFEDGCRGLCCDRRLGSMTKAVDKSDKGASFERHDDMKVPRSVVLERAAGPAPHEDRRHACARRHRSHFFIVTVVPLPGSDSRLNSSMTRFAPGSPTPRLFPVE